VNVVHALRWEFNDIDALRSTDYSTSVKLTKITPKMYKRTSKIEQIKLYKNRTSLQLE